MEDQPFQLQVRVGDGAARIGEAEFLRDNIVRPLNSPGKFNTIFVRVDPDPHSDLSRGVCVDYVGCGSVDKLDEVGQAGCHMDTQAPA